MRKIKNLDKFVKRNFWAEPLVKDSLGHDVLCWMFSDTSLENHWEDYWDILQVKHDRGLKSHLSCFFRGKYPDPWEKAFHRLLVLEDFKLWLDEKGVKCE